MSLSHGFAKNQLGVCWKYPIMAKVMEVEGHTALVLYMTVSPDGLQVISNAADGTL